MQILFVSFNLNNKENILIALIFKMKFNVSDRRNLSNEELKETYKIESSSLRERLMHAIVQATKEELEAETEVVLIKQYSLCLVSIFVHMSMTSSFSH